MLTKFKDYYQNSLLKDPKQDYSFDNSEKWFKDHSATTTKGSLVLGLVKESQVINFRNFIDINILPEIFETIKNNETNNIVFITSNSENDIYILESIHKKFPNINLTIKTISENVHKDIRLVELDNKIAITILESNKIFNIKNLIEYI